MTPDTRSQGTDDTDGGRLVGPASRDPALPPVAAHRSSPGRSVFVEAGNSEGWIASDTTTEVRE
ncbi:hypothetical protein BRC64_01105 [Halobacteriales archaeon QH_10_67_22]|jgi:hypothetical protein|nr:MAG: hypothetical protein BRC64_01105 [Halobacteriales archaeon QH_10_67_22]